MKMNLLKNLYLTFIELPQPVRLSTVVYFCFFFAYNVLETYKSSKRVLIAYRQERKNKTNLLHIGLKAHEADKIKNDWDAVEFGAYNKCWERFVDSLIWPFTFVRGTIPSIVLFLNPPLKE